MQVVRAHGRDCSKQSFCIPPIRVGQMGEDIIMQEQLSRATQNAKAERVPTGMENRPDLPDRPFHLGPSHP